MLTNKDVLKMKTNLRAFTLIEIIITVLIVGVIASIAFLNFGTVIEKSRAKEAEQTLYAIFANVQRVKIETGSIANVMVGVNDPFLNELRASADFSAAVVTFAAGTLTYTITRNAPVYTLTMVIRDTTTTPVITCSGGAAGLCAKLGY